MSLVHGDVCRTKMIDDALNKASDFDAFVVRQIRREFGLQKLKFNQLESQQTHVHAAAYLDQEGRRESDKDALCFGAMTNIYP